MEFNKELAKKIIEDNKLSTNLLAVWKYRGAIPDAYKAEYTPFTPPTGEPKTILKIIVQQKGWHGNLFTSNVAAVYRRLILNDKISYEKTCEILSQLGYEEITPPKWGLK